MKAICSLEMDTPTRGPLRSKRSREGEVYYWHHESRSYRIELADTLVTDIIRSLITIHMLFGKRTTYIANASEPNCINALRSQRQAEIQRVVKPIGFQLVLRYVEQPITDPLWLSSSMPLFQRNTVGG